MIYRVKKYRVLRTFYDCFFTGTIILLFFVASCIIGSESYQVSFSFYCCLNSNILVGHAVQGEAGKKLMWCGVSVARSDLS